MIPEEAVEAAVYAWGAAVWVFLFGVAFAFASARDRRWIARYFFAFPVWPFALGSIAVLALVKLWKAAEWKARK